MALRIGKKKADNAAPPAASVAAPAADPNAANPNAAAADAGMDDWSDFGNIPNDAGAAGPAPDTATNFDALIDDDAARLTTHTSAPSLAPTVPLSPAPDSASFTPPVPKVRRGPSKALLGGAAALVLLGGGAAYFLMQPPAEDEAPPDVPARKVRPVKRDAPKPRVAVAPPAKPGAKPVAAKPGGVKPGAKPGSKPLVPKPGAKPLPVGTPRAALRAITPGDRGIAQTGSTAPNVKPPSQRQTAQMVPVPGAPAPLKSASQPSAQPGMTAEPGAVRYAARPGVASGAKAMATNTGALGGKRARLKALWNDGADAKHRKDKATAKRLWQQGLKLAEASPRMDTSAAGFRDSLKKL